MMQRKYFFDRYKNPMRKRQFKKIEEIIKFATSVSFLSSSVLQTMQFSVLPAQRKQNRFNDLAI